MAKRDTQKARIYKAEHTATDLYSGNHFKQTIPTAELQNWVNKVMARKAIRSRWGRRHINVGLSRGGGKAWSTGYITLGVGARNEWYILHEIAHCLTWRHDEWAPHGPEFAGVYLFLIRTVIGDDAAKVLLAQYRKCKVRRNTRGIPKAGTHAVVTVRNVKRSPVRPLSHQRKEAADIIRQAARAGEFGPAGRKPRAHALATARILDPR